MTAGKPRGASTLWPEILWPRYLGLLSKLPCMPILPPPLPHLEIKLCQSAGGVNSPKSILGRACSSSSSAAQTTRSSTSMQSWTLHHCFNGEAAVNLTGQTERPWEVTIRLSYNFLSLKPMLKSSSKGVGGLKSGIFKTKQKWHDGG